MMLFYTFLTFVAHALIIYKSCRSFKNMIAKSHKLQLVIFLKKKKREYRILCQN